MVLCLIPSVGMLFFPTTQTTENKAMAPAPKLMTEDGTVNRAFFQDFERYFNEHIALRNPLVSADAKIQTTLFQESNVSGVISGTDGWLYYSSTLDDYLGLNLMTERELYNLAHNFSVVQDYVEDRDMDFVLTIPPNKNTLYGENMPYYKASVVNTDHNAVLLSPYLFQLGVNYLDLFTMFESQDETLYLKRDSHWNNKGACMAYNGIMDALAIPYEDYSAAEPALVKNENGDLNKMLYSFYGPLEENYDYALPQDYVYANEVKSVEDGWIITENENQTGKLLMFRDSFGNTLIPFFSNAFGAAYYSKGEPNMLETYVELYDPDCVVIQKVERNIRDYLDNPPILTAPEAQLPLNFTIASTETTLQLEESRNAMNYYKLSGILDESRMETESQVLVCVNGTTYRAYHTGDTGFCLYLKKEACTAPMDVQVYIVNPSKCIQALSTQLELP